MHKVEVDDTEYSVNGNPSMGIVRYTQEMEIEMMRKYLDDDVLLKMEGEDADMTDVLEDADMDDFKGMMWERSVMAPVKTICLGTDKKWTIDEIDDLKAMSFKSLKEACEEELGGDAEDFLKELDIDISSQVSEMQEQAQASPQETPNPALRTLNTQSKESQETEPTTNTQ